MRTALAALHPRRRPFGQAAFDQYVAAKDLHLEAVSSAGTGLTSEEVASVLTWRV